MASRKSLKSAGSRSVAARKRGPAAPAARAGARVHKWSGAVSKKSDALDLEPGVFKSRSARAIALSLKRSADTSRRRKSGPFQSAMSMLNFEINRGGRGLSPSRREVLNRAKTELRKAYGRA
jgi:hypothetical protein